MRFVTKAPAGQWDRAANAWELLLAKANTKAMHDIGKEARDEGRKVIVGAGFSNKFANSLVVKFIPSSGYVLDPAAYLHTTINYADIFETGAVIAGKPYLWLPLPNVPAGHGGRPHLSPKQYVAEIGPLFTIHPAGRPPMLATRITTIGPARPSRVSRGRLKRGVAFGRGQHFQTIPLYVGVPTVNIPKKFDTHAVFAEVASESNIQKAVEKNEERYIDPNGAP
jgi:hypothetical protein